MLYLVNTFKIDDNSFNIKITQMLKINISLYEINIFNMTDFELTILNRFIIHAKKHHFFIQLKYPNKIFVYLHQKFFYFKLYLFKNLSKCHKNIISQNKQ